jgi:hypothetical protein
MTIQSAMDTGQVGESQITAPGVKDLADLKRMFNDYQSSMEANRIQCLIDDDYYHAKQLTPNEKETLQRRGQPDIVVNRTRVGVNGVLGVMIQSKTDPKCWPRTEMDDPASDVSTDVLRYAIDESRWTKEKSYCVRDYLIQGTAAVIVGIDANKKPTITQIRWEEFFADPRSRRPDFKDAAYMGIAKWMYLPDVQAIYKDSHDDLENIMEGGAIGLGMSDESFVDRPINQGWVDYRARRVMVIEMYYRSSNGWWYKSVFFFAGVLEQGASPYKDRNKCPCNPIEATSCYVDRENNRYGIVRDMRSLQDEINKRRSKLLHLANNSQIQAKDPSAIEVEPDIAREEAARPDGVIPFGWEKVPTNDLSQGQAMLLAEAKAEMERLGPNPAVLGRQGSDTSGRALLARQQAGLIEFALVIDQFDDLELRVFRALWDRVKQYWTAEMVIRVTDDYEAPTYLGINKPIPNPQAGQPMVDENTGQQAVDPVTGAPIVAPGTLGYENSVAEMDVDIIIDSTPATATILQEMFKDLMDLVGSNPLYAEQVPFTMFLELMPGLPHKRRLIKRLQGIAQAQEQQKQQMQQQQIQLAVAEAMAKIKDMSTKGDLNTALATKAVGDTKATQVRATTQAAKAANDASLAHRTSDIAHMEANTHRYEVLQAAEAAKAEADAAASEGASE